MNEDNLPIIPKKKKSFVVGIGDRIVPHKCDRCKEVVKGVDFYKCRNKLCPIYIEGK